jgi:hypothetical protein
VVELVHYEGYEDVVVKFVVVEVFVNVIVFIVVVVEDNFSTIAFHLCHCL